MIGELEKLINEIFDKKLDDTLLCKNLDLKQKVYKVLLKYKFITKKEIDDIYNNFLKRLKLKMFSLQENIKVLKDIEEHKKNKHLIPFLKSSMLASIKVLDDYKHAKVVKNAFLSDYNAYQNNQIDKFQFSDKWASKILHMKEKEANNLKNSIIKGDGLRPHLEHMIKYDKIQEFRETKNGMKYIWLRTISKHPDEYHLTLVGKIFVFPKGDRDGNLPGERFGCKCDLKFI